MLEKNNYSLIFWHLLELQVSIYRTSISSSSIYCISTMQCRNMRCLLISLTRYIISINNLNRYIILEWICIRKTSLCNIFGTAYWDLFLQNSNHYPFASKTRKSPCVLLVFLQVVLNFILYSDILYLDKSQAVKLKPGNTEQNNKMISSVRFFNDE